VTETAAAVRVNIGCGAAPTTGWINLDNSPAVRLAGRPWLLRGLIRAGLADRSSWDLARVARSENIRYANAVRRIPCPDRSADVVYSSHMIEHLDRGEAQRFLREARRVLRRGGIIRLAAPDLSLLMQDYLRHRDADEFVGRTLMTLARPAGIRRRARSAVIGPRNHLWMYDGDSLGGLLRSSGFAGVAVLPPGETTILSPGPLDLKERQDGSVYVEAVNAEA
jgi:SAM-dependent methyltransferase